MDGANQERRHYQNKLTQDCPIVLTLSRPDSLLVLMLFVSVTSSYLHRKYHPMPWRSTSSPSPNFLSLRQRLIADSLANKSRSRLGSRSKPVSRSTCRMETVLLKLQPPRALSRSCRSVIVETNGCRGGCPSYSQIDSRNFTNIVHSCSCCQPLYNAKSAIIQLPCARRKNIEVRIKRVAACRCRPCYADKGTEEFHKLRDLLSTANSPLTVG